MTRYYPTSNSIKDQIQVLLQKRREIHTCRETMFLSSEEYRQTTNDLLEIETELNSLQNLSIVTTNLQII